jgi:dUTP pyrophosphatase
MIQFKLLNEKAILPTRATTTAAGFDMSAPESVVIPAGQSYWIPSGVAMAIPQGYVGLVWPRSGLAYKHSIDTLGGVIDSDYRGEVKIGLINHGLDPIEIKAGDRICQLVVQPYESRAMQVSELPEAFSNRTGGFGSTGLQSLTTTPVVLSKCIPTSLAEVQTFWAERNKDTCHE